MEGGLANFPGVIGECECGPFQRVIFPLSLLWVIILMVWQYGPIPTPWRRGNWGLAKVCMYEEGGLVTPLPW